MRKFKYLFLLIILVLNINVVKAFDNTKKVYDYAQVLTSKEEKNLIDKVNKYIKKYNMDMVLVTVRYHEKDNSNEYAKEFYNVNNFGIGNNKNGVIFVIDLTKGENIGLQTFGDSKKIYNNLRIDDIENDINNIDKNYYDKFNIFISKSNKYSRDGVETSIIKVQHTLTSIPWIKIFLLSLVTPFIMTIIYIIRNSKTNKNIYDNSHVVEGSIDINIRSDKFITTSTDTKREE